MMNKSSDCNNTREFFQKKNLRYSRYILVRYIIAIFFFSNIYWGLLLLSRNSYIVLVPIILILLFIKSFYEQIKLYSLDYICLESTKHAIKLQIYVNLGLVVICVTPFFTSVFPLLSGTLLSRVFVSLIVIIGCLIGKICLSKIGKIESNRDRFYIKFREMFDI